MAAIEFWQKFLEEKGLDKDTSYYECFYFDLTEEWANKLLELVLIGQKTATASSMYALEIQNAKIPEVGNYSIVTDFAGNPRCIIETTNVEIIPFNKMTYDICKREGEDDTLESWQQGHRHFFTEEGKIVGYKFTEDMPVVFEDFIVVYRNKQEETI